MPYVSERLAQTDQIKTGSNWTSRVMLRRARLPRAVGDGHLPAYWTRAKFPGRVHYGTCRHPVSWLVSWYRHARYRAKCLDALAEYGRGSIEWADVLAGVLEPGDHWPAEPLGFVDLLGDAVPVEADLWTMATRYFYARDGAWVVDALVPMEHLRDGLSLLGLDEDILGRKNEGRGEDVEVTESQRAAIWEACGPLAESLGYREDGSIDRAILPVLQGPVGEPVGHRLADLRRLL